MSNPTPDPLPLSDQDLDRLFEWITSPNPEWYPNNGTDLSKLIRQARTAIKLKEENEALRKAGDEMCVWIDHCIQASRSALIILSTTTLKKGETHTERQYTIDTTSRNMDRMESSLAQWRKAREEGV